MRFEKQEDGSYVVLVERINSHRVTILEEALNKWLLVVFVGLGKVWLLGITPAARAAWSGHRIVLHCPQIHPTYFRYPAISFRQVQISWHSQPQ